MVTIKTDNWTLNDIELVIFDKDGTFIDIHKYWGRVVELRAGEIIRYFGITEDMYKPLCDVMGYDLNTGKLPPDSPVGLYARGVVQEILLNFLQKNRIDAYFEDIERIFQDVGQIFIPEQEKYTTTINSAINLMKELKKHNVKMVVVTSDSKKNAEYTIAKRGLTEFFDGIYGAEDSSTAKTSGDIVKKVLKDTKFSAQKTICIGDTYDDFLMAKNSNLKACVNVSTGVVSFEQQKEFNQYCVHSLDEISILQS